MNVRPGEGLLTICHCCPCCCLWKVAPNLHDDINQKINRLDDLSVTLEEENCKACTKCISVMQVINKENNAEEFDAKNEETTLATMSTRFASTVINDLYERANVKDDRYLYF